MKIVEDGICTINLYHGTNAILLESIKKHGLGGINLNKEYKLLELLEELKRIAITVKAWEQEEFLVENFVIDKIIKQDVTGGGSNFRHGNLYLSSSYEKAKGYAANEYGSEMLSEVIKLYDRIKKVVPGSVLLDSMNVKYINIEDIKRKDNKPVVITLINCVEFYNLRKENGRTIDLERFEEEYKIFSVEPFSCEFEYLGMIPYEKLKLDYL